MAARSVDGAGRRPCKRCLALVAEHKGAGEFSTRPGAARLTLMPGRQPNTPPPSGRVPAGQRVGAPVTPGTLALRTALDQSPPLTALLQRLQQSRQRFAAIEAQLDDALRGAVRPGPLDDAGWSLLVSGGAAAAKLRQLLPQLQAQLRAQGWPDTPLRVRVQAR